MSVFLNSCLTSPGIQEPVITTWVIIDDQTAECTDPSLCHERQRQLSTMIGFQCVSPNNASKINNHHETLHRELNKYIEDK